MNVFLSYPQSEKKLGEEMGTFLRTEGFSVKSDAAIPSGSDWRNSIENALNTSDVVVLVVGRSDPGEWVRREWSIILKAAWARRARLVPVVLGDSVPPPFLSEFSWFRIDDFANLSLSFQSLGALLRGKRSGVVLEGPSPERRAQEKAEQRERFSYLTEMARQLREAS